MTVLRVWIGLIALLAAALASTSQAAVPAPRDVRQAAPASDPCPPRTSNAPGATNGGKTFVYTNFSRQNLTNADFTNAKLQGVTFLHANLTGADFTGATIVTDTLPTDFSFANLSGACFKNVTVQSPVYFTYADLTCASFDGMDLTSNVAFGAAPLRFTTPASGCRPTFRYATMNCEFFDQWRALDLSGASIGACIARVKPGIDFRGAELSGISFDGLDLKNSRWDGAVLNDTSFRNATLDGATGLAGAQMSRASLTNVSAIGVDFAGASLYSADFSRAELSGSRFDGAFLTVATGSNLPAARFIGAHMRNVSFANAKLQGVDFTYASLYSSGLLPSSPCTCTAVPCTCAAAAGAVLTGTNFTNAYLYNLDLASATTNVNGTLFDGAILIAANFRSVVFGVNGGAAPTFVGTMLQGANLGTSQSVANATLTGAFVDFGAPTNQSGGNFVYLKLSNAYTRFRGWKGAAAPCVETGYMNVTVAPSNVVLTCPNGATQVCGPTDPTGRNRVWWNGTTLATNTAVPGWYGSDTTFERATPGACTATNIDSNWDPPLPTMAPTKGSR